MTDLHQLLTLQDHDTRIDQLNHRRATMPERERLGALRTTGQRLATAVAELSGQRTTLAREQRRLEDQVAAIEEKRRSVDKAMYGGTVTNPRELQAMQEEMNSLARRQGQLEDQVIELMEQVEPIDARLAALTAEVDTNRSEVGTAEQQVAEAEADITSELARETAERDEARVGLPAELVEEYGHLRSRNGGVGVARLAGSQCGGCHLTLSAVEVARIKKLPPEAVTHCEECGRILVR